MSFKCQLTGTKRLKGHHVSHSNHKTNRFFLPNVRKVKFESVLLGKTLELKINERTRRTILNKYGTIDDYLLGVKGSNLTEEAQLLRTQVRRKLKNKTK